MDVLDRARWANIMASFSISALTEAAGTSDIDLRLIQRDQSIQGRVQVNTSVVAQYAELMRLGVQFPPIRLWYNGTTYWLSDGFHRVAAAERVGASAISAQVFPGTKDDAIWDSFGANVTHGLRRTSADVRLVLERAVGHPRGMQLSNNQLARHLGVAESTLRRWRTQASSFEDTIRLAKRGGKTYAIETHNIGKARQTALNRRRSIERLRSEFDHVKPLASPGVLKLLRVLEIWIFEGVPATVFLDRVEELWDCPDDHPRTANDGFLRDPLRNLRQGEA
jgi:transposase-like protein